MVFPVFRVGNVASKYEKDHQGSPRGEPKTHNLGIYHFPNYLPAWQILYLKSGNLYAFPFSTFYFLANLTTGG